MLNIIRTIAGFCQGLKKIGRIFPSLLKSRGDLNKNRETITAFINPLEVLMGELSPLFYF